jgi:hypothetical protein
LGEVEIVGDSFAYACKKPKNLRCPDHAWSEYCSCLSETTKTGAM